MSLAMLVVLLVGSAAPPATADDGPTDSAESPDPADSAEPAESATPTPVSSLMLSVYRWASAPEQAGCELPAGLVAGVGEVTSRHASIQGATVDYDGTVRPGIYGNPVLTTEGSPAPDTDRGLWDADPVGDRSAGPFQFIPASWADFGIDSNGDGFADPQNVWDAAGSAARFLCDLGAGDPSQVEATLMAYFGTDEFSDRVRAAMARFGSAVSRSVVGEPSQLATLTVQDGTTRLAALETDGTPAPTNPVEPVEGGTLLLGDWNGDGQTTAGTYRVDDSGQGQFEVGDQSFSFGVPGDIPLVGDWNADGIDDIGLYAISYGQPLFLLKSNDRFIVSRFGQMGDVPVIGDWDGDGYDGPGIFRPATATEPAQFILADQRGRQLGGPVSIDIEGGIQTQPVVGDWNGDGFSDLGVAQASANPDTGTPLRQFSVHGAQMGELVLAPATAIATGRWSPRPIPRVEVGQSSTATTSTGPDAEAEEVPLARVGSITVHQDIAEPLATMINAAAADGIVLDGWGWRSHQRQIELRAQNCADVWETPSSECSPPTATPGHSRHEIGKAIDFHVGGVALSRTTPQFQWLTQNAADYGFFNLPSEPWHWSVDGK